MVGQVAEGEKPGLGQEEAVKGLKRPNDLCDLQSNEMRTDHTGDDERATTPNS